MGKISAQAAWTVGIATGASLAAYAALTSLSATGSEVTQTIPQYGSIFQSGALVGWASGAKVSARDSSVVEFEQISHARQLAPQDEFEYGGANMRISQVVQVDYGQGGDAASGSAARPDKTLLRVTAKIRRSP
jgi:hypothetical protein